MQLRFMEELLRMEAEAKYFLGATERDRSYDLLPPRITEWANGFRSVLGEWKSVRD